MKTVVTGVALAALIANGCGAAQAESAVASSTAKPAALTATTVQTGIPGCAATLSVDVRRLLATPSTTSQILALWNEAKRELMREDEGPEAVADLASLGVRGPSDIHSIEMCVPFARRRDFSAHDRAGFLVRGPFMQGMLSSLVLKWAASDIDDLSQYKGVDVVQLDDGTLFAQRPDGSLVIATHASSLHALLDAPLTFSHSAHAIGLRVPDVRRVFRDESSRDKFPAHAVRSLDLGVTPALDRVHFELLATDDAAATEVLTWLQDVATKAARELDASRDARPLERAIVRAIAHADISKRDRTVTFVATLSSTEPGLSLRDLATMR